VQGAYRNGKKHGLWRQWNACGTKSLEGSYVDGLREGVWRAVPWVDHIRPGQTYYSGYSSDDEFESQRELEQEFLIGSTSYQRTYVKGVASGPAVDFYGDRDSARAEGMMADDYRTGRWIFVNESGVCVREQEYVYGEATGHCILYRVQGVKSEEGPTKAGKRHGTWRRYLSIGDVLIDYVHDKVQGPSRPAPALP